MNNWDPKIIAVIITSSIALVIGLLNIYGKLLITE